jgi:hypothetical protein
VEYPSLEARPVSAWNYGLALDPARLNSDVTVATRPLAADEQDDPWDHPATTLTVPARSINGWDLRTSPTDPGQKFTPPLPSPDATSVGVEIEQLTLVPYGSTQLRMSIFPWMRA